MQPTNSERRRLMIAGGALLVAPMALRAQSVQQIAPPVARITAPGATQPVRLAQARVETEIAGAVALTRVELTFFNPNSRMLEGELQFPLLEGQAIEGFALDINGSLRDAVPVEKARGQAVFEDVTRA